MRLPDNIDLLLVTGELDTALQTLRTFLQIMRRSSGEPAFIPCGT
jgi:hypothetical protein